MHLTKYVLAYMHACMGNRVGLDLSYVSSYCKKTKIQQVAIINVSTVLQFFRCQSDRSSS